MAKKIVHYRRQSLMNPPVVNNITFLQTLDHPGPGVTNWPQGDGVVYTSQIVRVGENGEFETQNTIYRPSEDV